MRRVADLALSLPASAAPPAAARRGDVACSCESQSSALPVPGASDTASTPGRSRQLLVSPVPLVSGDVAAGRPAQLTRPGLYPGRCAARARMRGCRTELGYDPSSGLIAATLSWSAANRTVSSSPPVTWAADSTTVESACWTIA